MQRLNLWRVKVRHSATTPNFRTISSFPIHASTARKKDDKHGVVAPTTLRRHASHPVAPAFTSLVGAHEPPRRRRYRGWYHPRKKTEMSIFFSLSPLTRQWRPRRRVHLPSRSHRLPRCIRRHTPRGSPAPNSTSSAPPCPPLAHRSPAPPNPLNSKISFSFSFFHFISNRCRTMWSPSSPRAHSGHRRNRCRCTRAGPVACTTY